MYLSLFVRSLTAKWIPHVRQRKLPEAVGNCKGIELSSSSTAGIIAQIMCIQVMGLLYGDSIF